MKTLTTVQLLTVGPTVQTKSVVAAAQPRPLGRARYFMKIAESFIAVVIFAVLTSTTVLAGDKGTFVSAGMKFGYTFGETRGFTFGFEVSINHLVQDRYSFGGVVDVDFCRHLVKFHTGMELAYTAVGFEAGPTFLLDRGQSELTATLTPYIGFIVYPYYSITLRKETDDIQEIGSYIKFPKSIGGPYAFTLG